MQSDFSAGMFRSVARHLIPDNGAYDLVNLLLTDDGSTFRRGGTSYLSTAALDTSLLSIWDGFLTPGQRTVIASPNSFGVLDASEGVIDLGGSGTATPKRAAELAGLLFFGDHLYGGSRKTVAYSTGTVSVTAGSNVITGTGTSWLANVDPGMLFIPTGGTKYNPVMSVDSNTQITLRNPISSTQAGLGYSLVPIAVSGGANYPNSGLWVVAGSRVWSLEGSKARFSGVDDPHTWTATDNHLMPEGAQLLGGFGVSDRALLFSTAGLHVISGIALDLTDAFGNLQHRNEHVSRELLLWSHEGIATWQGAAVAPCADGIWLVDGVGEPQLVSKSITPLYTGYVGAGYKTGLGMVVESHYLLPVLDGSNGWVDTLVVRLDRTVKSPVGSVRPFTRLTGFGAQMAGFAVRTGGTSSARNPKLLGASLNSTARVVDCTEFFSIDTSLKNDADGSTYETDKITRDYPTGDGRAKSENTVRRVHLRYELRDAATDDPMISGYWSDGGFDTSGQAVWDVSEWGEAFWVDDISGEWVGMAGLAPEDQGREPHSWDVNKRVRFIRFRFRTTDPASQLVYRAVELKVRPTGK